MRIFYASLKAIVLLFLIMPWVALAADSAPTDDIQLMNHRLLLLHDTAGNLSPKQAFGAYQDQQFKLNTQNQVSFGFTDDTIWGVLPIVNMSQSNDTQLIKIDNAWLDEIDIYFFNDGQMSYQVTLGDNTVFSQRPIDQRMPTVSHSFLPGETQVLFRLRSEDPMTIPIYLGSETNMVKAASVNAYFYGALYGAMSILLVYNLALYFYLRELKYLLYSAYLLAFTTFNFTYTGHGFWVLWPESTSLQQWLMPSLMFVYIFSAVMFTIEFLNTRVFLPSLYAARQKLYGSLIALAIVLLLIGERSIAVMTQLIVLTTLSVWMLVIGYFSYRNGNPMAKLFVPAILMGTGGATVSSFATWGIIPYSQWAFRGIEIGMLLEMSLLSISLGFNFKMVHEARKNAEKNARLDPLTSLYNRRAFPDLVHPIWELGKRNRTPMAIILIDLDWFKRINDQFGHAVGDKVLEGVAKELKARLRDSDIPLRWGGEEFLIFLPNTDVVEAQHLANSLRSHFDTTSVDAAHKVTMSIGVVSALPNQMDLDKLILLADEALYSAKRKGRNCVVAIQ